MESSASLLSIESNLRYVIIDIVNHCQPVSPLIMDYTEADQVKTHHAGPVLVGGC
jgi:hypothetical protein